MAKAKAKAKSTAPGKARGTLKVFRTPIGFHDAFVAAPSQKAALEAWGSDSNLFAQGVAELVTDPALMEEPLARPGEVVRRLRGSADEQVATLEAVAKKDNPSRSREGSKQESPSRSREGRKAKKAPRPSRAAVDKAERAVERTSERHRAALESLQAEEQALQKRRREIEAKQRIEHDALSEAVDIARERYRATMAEWAG